MAISKLQSFPVRLFNCLEKVDEFGLGDVISWLPCGQKFVIHDPNKFMSGVAPLFFEKQTKIRSFYRQLNIWNFERLSSKQEGPWSIWRNPHFTRDNAEGVHRIKRVPVKSAASAAASGVASAADSAADSVAAITVGGDQSGVGSLDGVRDKIATLIGKAILTGGSPNTNNGQLGVLPSEHGDVQLSIQFEPSHHQRRFSDGDVSDSTNSTEDIGYSSRGKGHCNDESELFSLLGESADDLSAETSNCRVDEKEVILQDLEFKAFIYKCLR